MTSNTFTREHLSIDKIRNLPSEKDIIKITIKADRKPSHYLFWERQTFGFTSEEFFDDYVIMHFDCTVHPTSFVRWFMKFADFGEIVSPTVLQTELHVILTEAVNKMNKQ